MSKLLCLVMGVSSVYLNCNLVSICKSLKGFRLLLLLMNSLRMKFASFSTFDLCHLTFDL